MYIRWRGSYGDAIAIDSSDEHGIEGGKGGRDGIAI